MMRRKTRPNDNRRTIINTQRSRISMAIRERKEAEMALTAERAEMQGIVELFRRCKPAIVEPVYQESTSSYLMVLKSPSGMPMIQKRISREVMQNARFDVRAEVAKELELTYWKALLEAGEVIL